MKKHHTEKPFFFQLFSPYPLGASVQKTGTKTDKPRLLTFPGSQYNCSHTKELNMGNRPDGMPDCTVFLLAKAYQKAHGIFKRKLKPYALTNLQHLVLEGLWYRTGQTAAELGKMLVLDKATLSGILDRMDEAGWIEKVRSEKDGRIFLLYPSEKAMRLKKKLIEEREGANEELLEGFTLEEQVLFKRLLWDLFID